MRYLSQAQARALVQTLQLALDRYDGATRVRVRPAGPEDHITFPRAGGLIWPFDIVLGPERAQLRVHLVASDGARERTLSAFRLSSEPGPVSGDLDLDRGYILVSGLLTNLRPHPADPPDDDPPL